MPDSANPEYIAADKTGRLVLPPPWSKKYGVQPGERVYITENDGQYPAEIPCPAVQALHRAYQLLQPRLPHLHRNTWKEPMGRMFRRPPSRALSTG